MHIFHQINNFPQFKDFCDVFYINLPNERNARINEIHLKALDFKNKTKEEIIKEIAKLTPYSDIQRMLNFQNDIDFSQIPLEYKKEFVDKLIERIGYFKNINKFQEKELQYPNDADKFLNFWAKIFRKNAIELFKKIIGIAKHLEIKNNELEKESKGIISESEGKRFKNESEGKRIISENESKRIISDKGVGGCDLTVGAMIQIGWKMI